MIRELTIQELDHVAGGLEGDETYGGGGSGSGGGDGGSGYCPTNLSWNLGGTVGGVYGAEIGTLLAGPVGTVIGGATGALIGAQAGANMDCPPTSSNVPAGWGDPATGVFYPQ